MGPLRKSFTLVIPGPPKGKDRPRFNTHTGHAVTSRQTRLGEALVRSVWLAAGSPTVKGPVHLTVVVFVDRPAAHFTTTGKLSALGGRSPYPDRQKPDLDNVVKLVADALDGLAIENDVRIVRLDAARYWSVESAHTLVRVDPL